MRLLLSFSGSPTEKHYGAKLIKGKICTQTVIPDSLLFQNNETNMELIIKPKFLTFSISKYKKHITQSEKHNLF